MAGLGPGLRREDKEGIALNHPNASKHQDIGSIFVMALLEVEQRPV